MNVVLTERGALEQRAGKTRFDTSGAPASPPNHIRNWYPTSSTRRIILSVNGDIYSCTTAGAFSLLFDGTAATTWCFEQGQDGSNVEMLWALNGVNNPKKISTAGAVSDWANSPPNGTMLRMWRNRMCIAGVAGFPQRLYYSDIGNPESPAATYGTNFIDIKTTDDDLDPITWLEVIGDRLLVFKKQSVWMVYDSNSFANERLGGPGCEDRFMSCVSEGRCYYFHRSGVWSVTADSSPEFESEAIEDFITSNLNYANISKVRLAASRDRRVFVSLPFGSATENSRVLELVPYLRRSRREGSRASNGAWTVHDYNCSALCTFRPVNQDVLMGGDTASGLMQLFNGTNDNGAAIKAWWKFGWRAIAAEEPYERVRRVNVELSGRVVASVFVDFSPGSKYSQLLETSADADPLWDGGQWDGGQWDAVETVQLKRMRPESRGRYHAVEFRNEVKDKSFKVLRAELVIRGGKEH